MQTTIPVELPGWIYDYYRQAAEGLPWVRLLGVHKRGRGEGQDYVQSRMSQALIWDARTEQLDYTREIDMRGPRKLEIDEWLEDDFGVPNWTRLELTCELDGTNAAVVMMDEEGPQAVDYLAFNDDPFWDHLVHHRGELEAVAREHVAPGRRISFRR